MRQSMDAANRRDLDAFLALMDEQIEVISRIVAVEGGLSGHDGVRRWWEGWFGAFPDYTLEWIDAQEIGDVVIAAARAVTHGARSEVPLEDRIWIAIEWRDGKAIWWQVFTSETEAVEAAELR